MKLISENVKLTARLGKILEKCTAPATYRVDLTKAVYDSGENCYVACNGKVLLAVHCPPLDGDTDLGPNATCECIGLRVLNRETKYPDWRKVVPEYLDSPLYRGKSYRHYPQEECHMIPYLDLYKDFGIKTSDVTRRVADELLGAIGFEGLRVYASEPNSPFVLRWDFGGGQYIDLVSTGFRDYEDESDELKLTGLAKRLESMGVHVDLVRGRRVVGNVAGNVAGNVTDWHATLTVSCVTDGMPCDYVLASFSGNVEEVEAQMRGILELEEGGADSAGVGKSA